MTDPSTVDPGAVGAEALDAEAVDPALPDPLSSDPLLPTRAEKQPLEPPVVAPVRPALGRVARAVLFAYVFRALGAALAAFPLVAAVGSSGIREFAGGDVLLFERGGLWLLELSLRERALLGELFVPVAALLFSAALASVVPQWLLLRALRPSPRADRSRDAVSGEALSTEAARTLPRLALAALATWIARVLLVLVTVALAMTARSYFAGADDERLPLLASAAVLSIGALAWACLSVLYDVTTIEVSTRDTPARLALNAALEGLRQTGFGLAARYGLMLGASAVLLVAAAAGVSLLDVARGGDVRTAGAALAHQITILALLALRAAWLWSAIRMRVGGPRSEEPGRRHAEAFL